MRKEDYMKVLVIAKRSRLSLTLKMWLPTLSLRFYRDFLVRSP